MKFSICTIMKNEARVLPRLAKSLKEFLAEGGYWICTDTGSTDNSIEVARSLGATVYEAGEKFITTIDKELADKINERFVIDNEKQIVNEGSKLFDFASARNYCADRAPTDMVTAIDGDEYFLKLNCEEIDKFIKDGIEMFWTSYIFAHDAYGVPVNKFRHNRFYNKTKMKYEGIVHEVPVGNITRSIALSEDVYMLDHEQERGKEHRASYLVGLALDCYLHQDKDRQSHYLARELMYTGRYKSAIKEFKRHISMNGWDLEAAQSMIFIGDCYSYLGDPNKQVKWYNKSFSFSSNRREPLIKLALYYRSIDNFLATIAFTKAAMEIPFIDYYANDRAYYTTLPCELLYWAYGWAGNISEARRYILKALEYNPTNPIYLEDTKYYFEYFDRGIDGYMTFSELQWLYETAKKMTSILEIGSWKGRSSHALLSGCKGTVTCVDHFQGSKESTDQTHERGKKEDVYGEFIKNVGHFENLEIIKASSQEASEILRDRVFDMVFIDAGHTYEEVKQDIELWKDRAKIILCGHDYSNYFQGVKQAVIEQFSGIELTDTIWYKKIYEEELRRI